MPRPASKQPTDTELEILNVLWDSGPARLSEICAAVRRHRSVAVTTVATMLKVMLNKNLVKRTSGKRGIVWQARLGQRTAHRGMLRHLLDRAFDGSARNLVVHLLEDGELSDKDQKALRRMLSSKSKKE